MTTFPFEVIEYQPGMQITRNCIVRGMPMAVYHSATVCDGPSFSSTHLRKADSQDYSLEELFEELPINPDYVPKPDTETFIRGRAVHLLLLGEGGFQEQFKIRPETYPENTKYPSEGAGAARKPWNGNANWCKEWLAEAEMERKSVLKADVLPNIHGMAKKLAAHPVVQSGILNGLIEHSIFWRDPATGLWLRARPDSIPTESAVVGDLKGADDVSPLGCRRSITEYGYNQQLALVAEGIYQVTGRVMTDFVLIFVKWTKPWSINHKPLTAQAIYRGRQQNRRAIDRIAACVKSGVWPGYDDDEVPADLMEWREKQLTFENEKGLLPDIEPDMSNEPRDFSATPATASNPSPSTTGKIR